jgi:uncharacterized membrane protein HdeD (DUF308 family)
MTTTAREPILVEPLIGADPLTHATGWPTIIRGLLAILFGVIAIARPQATALALVILFAVWAIMDGGFDLFVAVQRGRAGARWGWFLFEGLVSIAAGVLALVYPGVTILVLTILVAARALVMGAIMLTSAFTSKGSPHRWLYGLTGVVSVLFGFMLLLHPVVGALALVWTIGIYAIIFGVTLIALGIQVHMHHRRREKSQQPESRGEAWGPQAPTPSPG